MSIQLGYYQHYKNKKTYKVIAVGKHSETLEEMVVYEAQYDNPVSKIWIRPVSMFEEIVNFEGEDVPRFQFLHK